LFGAPPDKDLPTTYYAADLVERLHDIHHYARQHPMVAIEHMMSRYDRLANPAGFQE
jgi:hypothetical protein